MKLHGDVSEGHKKLAAELEALEVVVRDHPKFTPDVRARSYVCLAHDWYCLGAEEEGHRLLELAESVCPGYFKEIMLKQTQEDSSFTELVTRLSSQLAWIILSRLEEVKNK